MVISTHILTELYASAKSTESLAQYLQIVDAALLAARKRYSKKDIRYVYYEQHHILPKSLYPQYSKDKANLVLLTAEEHFTVHQLLTYILPGREMAYAFWRMCCCNSCKCEISAEAYAYGKHLHSLFPPAKGIRFTDETKALISKKSKDFWQRGGYTHAKEQDLKMVETRRRNGSYSCSEERKAKTSQALKGRIFINNGEQNKRIYPDELDSFLACGWVRGKKPLTEEHKRNIGQAGTGRQSWNKGKSGTFLGKKHSDEAKRKMSETKRRKKDIINVT